jgi:AcrR family transcriptional regulator
MSAVAKEAGVATGTAYTYYGSKEELVIAAYLETKLQMGEVALSAADPDLIPEERFVAIWTALFEYLMKNRDQARFLVQIESSPYLEKARSENDGEKGPFAQIVEAEDMASELAELSPIVIYELGIAPAVRLAAGGVALGRSELAGTATGCWRAISRPN